MNADKMQSDKTTIGRPVTSAALFRQSSQVKQSSQTKLKRSSALAMLITMMLITMMVSAQLFLSGCSSKGNPDRIAVEGTVRHEGVSIKKGIVYLIPAKGHAAPTAGPVPIEDGNFKIPSNVGPIAGKYKVRVTISSAISNADKRGSKLKNLKNDSDKIPEDELEGTWEFQEEVPEKDQEADEEQVFKIDLKLDAKHRISK